MVRAQRIIAGEEVDYLDIPFDNQRNINYMNRGL